MKFNPKKNKNKIKNSHSIHTKRTNTHLVNISQNVGPNEIYILVP
jgi:hypothetical protein